MHAPEGHSTAPARSTAGAPPSIRQSLRDLTEHQRRWERHLAERLDVDAPGHAAMAQLNTEGESTPTELARRLGLSTAATSLVLNRLEAAGHVRREPHPSDRRKVRVLPADASRAEGRRLVRPVLAEIDALVAALSEAEHVAVATFLSALARVYDDHA